MQGFKEFIMKGNLVELAVAFIMATAFAAVVTAMVDLIMAIVSKVFGGPPSIDEMLVGGVNIGPFLSAVIAFVLLAAVVYFLIVLPYNKAMERFKKEDEETVVADDVLLLQEIRDLLAGSQGAGGTHTPTV